MPHARTKPATQQRTYGVLVGTIHDGRQDPPGHSPHYEIWVQADTNYRIAVNVRSADGSDVLAHYDPNFTKPTKRDLASLAAGKKGFTALPTGPGGAGLDYLRDDLFPIDVMALIPTSVPLPVPRRVAEQRERAKHCAEDALFCTISKLSSAVKDAFASSPKTKSAARE